MKIETFDVSGGDHCFVSVINQEDKILPFDCRIVDPKTQILTLTLDYIKNLLSISSNSPVDQDILSFLESFFKSLSCINGSFLLNNDNPCTSKYHGVDVEQADEAFTLIARIENESIKDLVRLKLLYYTPLLLILIKKT